MAHDFMHIGHDVEPRGDLGMIPKVTGEAKYADDILFDNLLHAKTVKSPYAHAYVEHIDTSGAEAMTGVEAVVTFEDAPDVGPVNQPALDREPSHYGAPVAAVAAEDEYTAAEAVEEIYVEYRVLPQVTDLVETLKPDGPNARMDGNAPRTGSDGPEITTIKWDDADFSTKFPSNPGEFNYEWGSWGDLDNGFSDASVIIEDTLRAHDIPQNPMEPRSNVAYWNNDKLHYWASTQSVAFSALGLMGAFDLGPQDIRFHSNFCGGGFGSKATSYPQMFVPPLLSMKTGRPVKIRGTRKEEFFWGNARTELLHKFKLGFKDDGRMSAADVSIIGNAGAYSTSAFSGISSSLSSLSAMFNPESMRGRGMGVFTNTPKKWAMRSPGQTQLAMVLPPLLDQAAEELGMDRLELRLVNAATHRDPIGPDRVPNTSAYLREAFEKAADMFGYDGRQRRVEGSKVYGIGISSGSHGSGALAGFDGCIAIKPDGRVQVNSGIGNLGTYSYLTPARAAAEVLQVPWEQVDVKWGESMDMVFTLGQFGSNTTGTNPLTQSKAARTAVQYLKEIAVHELGGDEEDYEVADGEVRHVDDSGRSISFAEAASIAIDLGGKYTGEEIPDEDVHPFTQVGASDLIGEALVAFAHTRMEDYEDIEAEVEGEGGSMESYVVALGEVSFDTETGKVELHDVVGVADCGTVVHPRSAKAQIQGGITMGIGYSLSERAAFDEGTGIPYNADWYSNGTPSILDYADVIEADAVDEPDLFGAHGTKGLGEPPCSAGAGIIPSAIRHALGATMREYPALPNRVLELLENGEGEV